MWIQKGVLPTRNGRRGHLFTRDGVVRIGRREHEAQEAPLDPECPCEACRRHSRAYLHHLFAVGEHSATVLGSLHDLTFLVQWVATLRSAVLEGTFEAASSAMATRYRAGEERSKGARAEDPEGARGSRDAAKERRARREEGAGRGE